MKSFAPLSVETHHPAYAGHFPNYPVYPGAALLDQALACLQAAHGIDLRDWRISSAKFVDKVRPGDAPVVEHEALSTSLIHFTIRVGSRDVVTGALSKLNPGAAA